MDFFFPLYLYIALCSMWILGFLLNCTFDLGMVWEERENNCGDKD